jgi:hypothetical protein
MDHFVFHHEVVDFPLPVLRAEDIDFAVEHDYDELVAADRTLHGTPPIKSLAPTVEK